MKVTVVHFLSAKECPYTFRGLNLAHMRRSTLFRLARAFDIGDAQTSKNDLLLGVIGKLRTLNAENEIADMIED